MNSGLLAKWAWRYKTEHGRLWRFVINSIHFNRKHGNFLPSKKGLSGVWANIAKIEAGLHERNIECCSLIKGDVGNGMSVQFWTDLWLDEGILQLKFPALFALENHKGCLVRDKIQPSDAGTLLLWEWHCPPASVQELSEMQGIRSLLSSFMLTDRADNWTWAVGNGGSFSVKSIRKLMSDQPTAAQYPIFEWNKWVPKKINIFGWRINMDRIPTRVALSKRNINLPSLLCPFCNEKDETTEHILTSCQVSSVVWQMMSNWLKIPPIFAFSVKDLLQIHKHVDGSVIRKKTIQALTLIACWWLWKLRNEIVFSNMRLDIANLLADIKSSSFLWIKNRAKMYDVEWQSWCAFAFV